MREEHKKEVELEVKIHERKKFPADFSNKPAGKAGADVIDEILRGNGRASSANIVETIIKEHQKKREAVGDAPKAAEARPKPEAVAAAKPKEAAVKKEAVEAKEGPWSAREKKEAPKEMPIEMRRLVMYASSAVAIFAVLIGWMFSLRQSFQIIDTKPAGVGLSGLKDDIDKSWQEVKGGLDERMGELNKKVNAEEAIGQLKGALEKQAVIEEVQQKLESPAVEPGLPRAEDAEEYVPVESEE